MVQGESVTVELPQRIVSVCSEVTKYYLSKVSSATLNRCNRLKIPHQVFHSLVSNSTFSNCTVFPATCNLQLFCESFRINTLQLVTCNEAFTFAAMKKLAYLFTVIIFASCEKTINFQPNNADPLLVVEATIESGQPPLVILSNSLDYFSKITPDILANSFVRNADIYISDGTNTHKLKEYAFPNASGYTLYYYTNDSSNLSTAIIGKFNTNYSIRIVADGKEYTASTTIPLLAKQIDSLWWKPAPDNPDTNKVVLMSRVTDPPGFGNYIRYFTSVNGEMFFPGIASVFDDQIVDGTTYELQVERGVNRNEDIDFEEYSFFERGDTVTVKFTNIDKATFDFWRTMEFSYSSIGNPFSSPTKVMGNVKGALGYFGGYAVQYKSLIIPK